MPLLRTIRRILTGYDEPKVTVVLPPPKPDRSQWEHRLHVPARPVRERKMTPVRGNLRISGSHWQSWRPPPMNEPRQDHIDTLTDNTLPTLRSIPASLDTP